MKSKQELTEFYNSKVKDFSKQLLQLKKRNQLTAYGRGAFFLLAAICGYFCRGFETYIIVAVLSFPVIIFFVLVALSFKLSRQILLITELIEINKKELGAINGDFSQFYSGKEFINYDHPFSYDLDVFGDGSIYQYINRTGTFVGRNFLADRMQNPMQDKSKIISTQNSVNELKDKIEWRQIFLAKGNLAITKKVGNAMWFKSNLQLGGKSPGLAEITEWLKREPTFAGKRFFELLLKVFPVVSLVMLALVFMGIIPFIFFAFWGILLLGITGAKMKDINNLHSRIGRKFSILKNYSELIQLIEKEDFASEHLNSLKERLKTGGIDAGESVKKLASLINALDNRLNMIFAIVANGLFLWDLQFVVRIEKWQLQYRKQLPEWFDVMAEYDALSSFANFMFNHPRFTFPELSDKDFVVSFEAGGHPLLPDDVRVNNDFELVGKGNFSIITGANMAGKSTFLRTVGINIVLAGCGSVVCADKFRFSPIKIHTSVRTNDSLQKSESYFYAELKRLHGIIERLDKNENLFVIVDEMLRGTNSKDKHHGSMAFTEQLSQQNAIGLIATHDIGLGELSKKYPEKIKNNRFEVEITDEKLHFNYKLEDGISQNLNATFLMKQMGIIRD